MATPQVTIKKIAELAGVSRGTVDKVLNDRPGVSAKTTEKVLAIAKELNYQPNIIGKALVSKTPLKLGIILTPEYNPFIGEMLKGIRRAEQEFSMFNLDISVQMLSTLEPAEQIAILNTLRDNGVQGIALFPIDNEQVIQRANAFADDGIAIITVNSQVAGIRHLTFVGQDHKRGGRAAAGLLNKLLPAGGDVGIIVSSYNLSCHKDRLSGFESRANGNGSHLRIVEVQENQDRMNKAFEITLDYCNRYPNLAGLYITSGGVTGCAKALKLAKKEQQVKLICHDVTAEVKELLADGIVDFVIDQKPQRQGYELVKVLFDYLIRKQQPALWIEIPVELVTEDLI
ncbi:MAG: substrate-binding domain-containing protein [Oscillospiraceae bacterium]|nr:substrate-binding domain-containing protein [Oscillospiraceae bacterium]